MFVKWRTLHQARNWLFNKTQSRKCTVRFKCQKHRRRVWMVWTTLIEERQSIRVGCGLIRLPDNSTTERQHFQRRYQRRPRCKKQDKDKGAPIRDNHLVSAPFVSFVAQQGRGSGQRNIWRDPLPYSVPLSAGGGTTTRPKSYNSAQLEMKTASVPFGIILISVSSFVRHKPFLIIHLEFDSGGTMFHDSED